MYVNIKYAIMITKDTIDSFIQKIPPAPEALKKTLIHLKTLEI